MSLFFDILIIIFLFVLFAVPHSLLAAFGAKSKIAEEIGSKIAFYRLFYNVISILTFIAIYYLSPKPKITLYDLDFPFDILIFAIQLLGIIGLFWSASYLDIQEFIGLSQIKRYFEGTYKIDSIDENQKLIVKGPFKYSRHPIYFFSIIVLGFRATMDIFSFIFLLCALAYFYIGSIFEEKNLTKRYGRDYSNYKKRVPRLIPNPFLFIKF
ncbi:MAG: hypothetical protein CR986_02380 [Ignavibacteriae bacterium]|nr:MAG: hypothetical protein CR986_02380 [Ignavibacteriota bacterium]